MRLVFQLITRLFLIVALCVGAAIIWAAIDAYRSVDRATAASAQRVSQALEALYWQDLLLRSNRSRQHLLPVPEWRTLDTMKLISPGVCVQFEPIAALEKPLCGQDKGIGRAPPAWFATTVHALLGNHAAVAQSISARTTSAGTVSAVAGPDAAIRLAWQHILDSIAVALLMALAIGLLASLAIAHTLAPARSIVTALRRMADGEYKTTLPRFRSMELAMIGHAVTALGERLAQATEQRAALTQRLLDIRDDERRTLARELHDEFGQNLTAILAFANTIEAAGGRQDNQQQNSQENCKENHDRIAQDARMISQTTLHIMSCLRDTLKRLRHPPTEELGLEASLLNLVETWRLETWRENAVRPSVRLDLHGDLTDVRGAAATTAYRVAQECLTNALRHGAAHEISLRIERRSGEEDELVICVEDDGGGDAASVAQSTGFGLTGMRERVAAVGGSLAIARATRGLSVAATIPIAA